MIHVWGTSYLRFISGVFLTQQTNHGKCLQIISIPCGKYCKKIQMILLFQKVEIQK